MSTLKGMKPFLRRENIFDVTPRTQWPENLGECTTFFVSPNRVSVARSSKITQVRWSKDGNSSTRIHYWKPLDSVAITYNPATGKFNTLGKSGKVWQGNPHLDRWLDDGDFKRACVQAFGGTIEFADIYPLAAHFGIHESNDYMIPSGIRGGLKCDNLKEMVNFLFGKTRYRRHLARAVARAHLPAIAVAREFRGQVPVDWIVEFLENNPADMPGGTPRGSYNFKGLRSVVCQLSPHSRRTLLFGPPLAAGDYYEINDCAQYGQRRQVTGRVQSWDDLHNLLLGNYGYGRQPIEPKAIPLTAVAKRLKDLEVGDFRVVLPECTSTLAQWGQEMRNCIGSYGYAVAVKDAKQTLGGIYHGDRLVVNFEINGKTLRQFLGKCNAPTRAVAEVFEPIFASHGIEIPDNYWGANV